MKKKTVATILAAIMVGLASFAWIFTASTPKATAVINEEVELLNLINNYRAQNGLGKLVLSQKLTQAAAAHSADMASKNYFQHNSLNGASFSDRIKATGYPGNTYLGENIAAGYPGALDTFNRWKNSPGHNAIMLGKNFKAVGINRAANAGSNYKWYWTADFGGVADAAVQIAETRPQAQAQQQPPAPPVLDAPNWADAYMQDLIRRGIITGYPDGTLRPTRSVTRAEFCVMVAKAYRISPKAKNAFKDTKNSWARGYIAALSDRGCISGYKDGSFRPNRTISRAEMAKIICQAAGLKRMASAPSFKDMPNNWSRPYILTASSNGVLKGFVNGKFKPEQNCSRGESAATIYRLLNR